MSAQEIVTPNQSKLKLLSKPADYLAFTQALSP